MADKVDILKNIKYLGLNKEEASIYKELLFHDNMSVTQLSKAVNIPRTTVYRTCERLEDKRFVEWIIEQRGRKVKAVTPDRLNFLIEGKKNEYEETKKALSSIKKFVRASSKKVPYTQVRYFKGREGMKQLIWNTLRAKKSIVGYSVYGRKEIVGKSFIEKYVIEFKKRKLTDKVLINDSVIKQVKKSMKVPHQQTKEHIRIIPEKFFYISGDTYIYNNIYAVNFWNKDEIVGVEIENPEIVKVQRSIFNVLWKQGKILR